MDIGASTYKETFVMKRKFLVLTLVFTLLLTACSIEHSKDNSEDNSKYDSNNSVQIKISDFYNPATNIHYVYCTPMKLYPNDPEKEEYLVIENEDGSETVFYGVQFEDPEEFLCYKDSGCFFLAMNADLDEPTLAKFNPIAASIYDSSNLTYIDFFWADNEYLSEGHNPSEDTWLCRLVTEAITDGESVDISISTEEMSELCYLRMLSKDYPGLHYLISFFGYNGRYFLRDSSINKTVYCPNDVIARLVNR